MTRVFRVYGQDGHRQREAFFPSINTFDVTDKNGKVVAMVSVANADLTDSHMYSEIYITADTYKNVLNNLKGQVTDGVFEDCMVGKVTEVTDGIESEIETSEWWA